MIIGLTGNIGSGKSTACRFLAELGAAVIDADRIGHAVLRRGGAAYADIIAAFGTAFLDAEDEIDRRRLGEHIFADHSGRLRQQLNAITHPAICNEIRQQIGALQQQEKRGIVLEAALLLDSPLRELVDTCWLVTAPRDILLARVMARDGCRRQAAADRLAGQTPQEELAKRADRVFVNDGDTAALAAALAAAYAEAVE